jgi:bifunctional non-homologous end joining protein LigD
VRQMGLEGIIAKQRNSAYLPGKRSDYWLKIKAKQTAECVIIGYVRGEGDRASTFRSLHIAQANGNELKYCGKVGGGFDDRSLKAVFAEIQKLKVIKKPIKEKTLDDSQSTWVEPKLVCEVEYLSLTKDGILREPVFMRLRPDLSVQQS